jgi:hypothetical protein
MAILTTLNFLQDAVEGTPAVQRDGRRTKNDQVRTLVQRVRQSKQTFAGALTSYIKLLQMRLRTTLVRCTKAA